MRCGVPAHARSHFFDFFEVSAREDCRRPRQGWARTPVPALGRRKVCSVENETFLPLHHPKTGSPPRTTSKTQPPLAPPSKTAREVAADHIYPTLKSSRMLSGDRRSCSRRILRVIEW